MVAAEAAAAGSPPLVARHSGLAEIADGLGAGVPAAPAPPRELRDRRRRRARAQARASCSRSPGRTGRRVRAAARDATVARWSWAGVARRLLEPFNYPPAAMGDEQRLGYEELLDAAREGFESGHRLHRRRRGGVRAPRPGHARPRQPLRGGAGGRGGDAARAAPRRRADRLRGRDQDGPLRDVRRRSRPRWPSAARSSQAARRPARDRARRDRHAPVVAAGRTSGSSTRRTTAATTSSSATSSGATTPSGSTSTSASAAPTARSRSRTASATSCPELLALSASSPFVENVNTGLHSARTQIFTRFFPRCGVPDAFASWQQYEDYVRFLYETGSVTEHTQLWWSVRPHLAFPTVEIRIGDGAARPRRGAGARRVRRPRSRPGSRARTTRASRSPTSRTG